MDHRGRHAQALERDRKKSLRLTEAGFYYSPEHPRLAVAKVVN